MKETHDFWRLLRDYEHLTEDETVALREENFPAIADVQSRKAAISAEMIKLAARAGINMLGERLDALIAAGKRNSSIAQEKLAAIDCERKKLDTAGKRLRKFGRAYKSDAQGGAAFSAQS